MLTPKYILLLGKLSISLNTTHIVERAGAMTGALSVSILPAIPGESNESRDLRGYDSICRESNYSYRPEKWMAADDHLFDNHRVLFGGLTTNKAAITVIPGNVWHLIVSASDPIYHRNDLQVIRKNMQSFLEDLSKPNTAHSFCVGESKIAEIPTSSDETFSGGATLSLPSGEMIIKVRRLRGDLVPVAADLNKLRKDLGDTLFSFNGAFNSILIRTIYSHTAAYKEFSGLETVSSIRLGDGKGAGFIKGFYKIDDPKNSDIDIETEMRFDRGNHSKAYLQYKEVIENITILGHKQ